jgi:structural maintenance of chromosome 1
LTELFLSTFCYSDLRSKAKRWDEKNVEAMKKKRNDCLASLKELVADRRKKPALDNLKSQIEGLRTRLLYTQREVESNVRAIHLFFVNKYIFLKFIFFLLELTSQPV